MSIALCSPGSSFPHTLTTSRRYFGHMEPRQIRGHLGQKARSLENLLHQAVKISNEMTVKFNMTLDHDIPEQKEQSSMTEPSAPIYFDATDTEYSEAIDTVYSDDTEEGSTTKMPQAKYESDSEYEDLEDVVQDEVSDMSRFGRAGTKNAAVNWFKETQVCNVRDPNKNRFAEWFHGIISRKEAERLLEDKMVGCFLIRVSESRFGYSLSFRAETRCRHYMIDQLRSGKFVIIGEPKVHNSLHELIDYHMTVKISNWNHFLTVPCGQDQEESDYAELVRGVYFELEHKQQAQEQRLQAPEPTAWYSLQRFKRQSSLPNIFKFAKPLLLSKPNLAKRPLPKLPEDELQKMFAPMRDRHRTSISEGDTRAIFSKSEASQRRASVF